MVRAVPPLHVTLHGKRDFVNAIKLRLLRWGGYPELLSWAPCNYKGLYKRKAKMSKAEEGNGRTEAEVECVLKMKKGLQARVHMASRSWKRQGNVLSLKTPEVMEPCQHCDFRLLTSRTVRE